MVMLDLHIATFAIVFIFVYAINILVNKYIRKIRNNYLLVFLRDFYCLLLVKVTLLPIAILRHAELSRFSEAVGKNATSIQMIPFHTILRNFESASGIVQFFGNLILLVPIACFLKYFSSRNYSNKKITGICALVSIVIEVLQFFITKITVYPMHATDIDDIILNTCGCILFLAICKVTWIDKLIKKIAANLKG